LCGIKEKKKMKPILPRPLLWTEIKTMDEFLRGERFANLLYNNFHWLQKYHSLPVVDELVFFNELYYQLTRYYYEHPDSVDYLRYVVDIKKNIDQECYVDLLMTMMYHYCRLRGDSNEQLLTDGFMRTIVNAQCQKKYWSHFLHISPSGLPWMRPVSYPQKPCPVVPKNLDEMDLDWDEITHKYNLKVVKGILNLWEKEDSRAEVAVLIKLNYVAFVFSSKKETKANREVMDYLEVMTRGKDSSVSYIKELKQEIEELKEKLRKAEELDKKRIEEIDGWHNVSEDNLSRSYEWESKYEEEVEKNKKAEYVREELEKVKQENVNLRVKIEQLKEKQDEDGFIMATAKKYLDDNPFNPDIILKRFAKDEEYKKKEKILEDKIKELQDRLGEETVQLSMIAEGIKNYSEEAGINAAYHLFSQLNDVLIEVPAWTKNVPDLKKFFRKARKDMEKGNTFENAQVTMQQPTINGPINEIHNNDKVSLGG
jgi:hypothetical protein